MKLFEILKVSDDEITVFDKEYDCEIYFNGINGETEYEWDKLLIKMSKVLEVTNVSKKGITVDLSGLIKDKLPELEKQDLFHSNDIDDIMTDIENIMAGNVSEKWFKDFVAVLTK